MFQDSSPPSWQRSPCDVWCARQHEEEDFDSDRDHQSKGRSVTAMRPDSDPEPDKEPWLVDELDVWIFREDYSAKPFIELGYSYFMHENIEVSVAGTELLAGALKRAVATAAPTLGSPVGEGLEPIRVSVDMKVPRALTGAETPWSPNPVDIEIRFERHDGIPVISIAAQDRSHPIKASIESVARFVSLIRTTIAEVRGSSVSQ